jgi:nucleoside-diphosphate-sugar epimerase
MGGQTVEFAAAVRRSLNTSSPKTARIVAEEKHATAPQRRRAAPRVLVLGGTGFIGRALVRKLNDAGHSVRVLARHPGSLPKELRAFNGEVVGGDFVDSLSVAASMDGIGHVYHLARGGGHTWPEYVSTDVDPTRRLGEMCAERGVGLYYASSIAIYNAGRAHRVITEDTPPHAGIVRSNLYVRSKAINERNLFAMHQSHGLHVIVFRPGIVIGTGANPMHCGVAGWPYPTVSRLWGAGRVPLPIVLVNDCADAMARALGRKDLDGQSFNLVGEADVTAHDYLDELERVTGLRIRRVATSSVRYFAEEVAKYTLRTLGRDPNRRRPSYAEFAARTCCAAFDTSRAKERLAWEPTKIRDVVVRQGIHVPAREYFDTPLASRSSSASEMILAPSTAQVPQEALI